MVIQGQALKQRGSSHCGNLCTLKKNYCIDPNRTFFVLDIYLTAKTMGFKHALKKQKKNKIHIFLQWLEIKS